MGVGSSLSSLSVTGLNEEDKESYKIVSADKRREYSLDTNLLTSIESDTSSIKSNNPQIQDISLPKEGAFFIRAGSEKAPSSSSQCTVYSVLSTPDGTVKLESYSFLDQIRDPEDKRKIRDACSSKKRVYVANPWPQNGWIYREVDQSISWRII